MRFVYRVQCDGGIDACLWLKRLSTTQSLAYINTEGQRVYCINNIIVPKHARGNRYGSTLLRKVISDADIAGAILILIIVPQGHLDRHQLSAWYRRHGFRKKSNFQYMVRRPRKV